MKAPQDFLVEIHTEELPPKALQTLASVFLEQIKERLQKAEISFTSAQAFATPRRLAVLVNQLASEQPSQTIERKGPALAAAFDPQGNPTPACIGFARSCGVEPSALTTIKSKSGDFVGYKQSLPGKPITALLPSMVEQALLALPIPKRMRWGEKNVEFIRPIHSIIMLYGQEVIDATILGYHANRLTRGHRFHTNDWISIPQASAYADLLEKKAFVIADFTRRRTKIREQVEDVIKKLPAAHILWDEKLLDEVTGIVEWPVAFCGNFDKAFLELPKEVLISAMQDHQRYFPIANAEDKLLPCFVAVSNIASKDLAHVIHGNERVLRARLSDANFFYTTDKKISLEQRLSRLKDIVYHAKLGSLYDKAERLNQLARAIVSQLHGDVHHAARAASLAKTDLTTEMVGEFPELQGIMGSYYAQHDNEAAEVAQALREQYLPRFAGDILPNSLLGCALALADRIDTLVGSFGINQLPTGDKDPFGLRRAAIGLLRILIEKNLSLDVKFLFDTAATAYGNRLENLETVPQLLQFIQERLKAWYHEQGVAADVFAAVAALKLTQPLDIHQRIQAVQRFKTLAEAQALSAANKRVSNILSKYENSLSAKTIDPHLFEHPAERELAQQLEEKNKLIAPLFKAAKYVDVLTQLAALHKPIDDFFDHVLVMAEDKAQRENRLLLLMKLRALFLQVADIALLQ